MKPEILTVSGKMFNFVDLDKNEGNINIQDIAWSLSQQCRYTGHCKYFYSIAQHSALVCDLLPPHLRVEGLLHDAAEAFLGDVATPLKQLLPEYKDIEHRVESWICKQFGIPYPMSPEVKEADTTALRLEMRDLMYDPDNLLNFWVKDAPQDKRIRGMNPMDAYFLFMNKWRSLQAIKRVV